MKQKKNQPSKWLYFVTIPTQMGVVIFVFSILGAKADEYYRTAYLKPVLTLFGVFLALYQVIKKVQQISREDED
ncbi:AtpZ/AtpI family protein [Flavobacterium sp. NRK F10]|uniref:F0F1-ATPase subunit n=1 Tax=Flavobacterium sediminis TaxID=2201181 RepID=A0A2U8QU93_9FLAO|nr:MULTISPECIES: AtpZ/AtpI family protein [Flavobacterium]AWM13770.1 F0F1-ATPase subunit [Flavobacterium sediminis]MCO6174931.1 AtpZ/AtpI family protein [Flavobacterium sp. NRK F10]